MDCRVPYAASWYPDIRAFCWMTDNRLLLNDWDSRVVIMDVDYEHKLCNTTVHQHGDAVHKAGDSPHQMTCSDTGEAYVLASHYNDHIHIYKDEHAPERWDPSEHPGKIESMAMNKNYIALTVVDHNATIYIYNMNKVFLYKIDNADTSLIYSTSYLSEGNFLWCAPASSLRLTVYDLNTNTSISINGPRAFAIKSKYILSGYGEYVVMADPLKTSIVVYFQNGTYSHELSVDVPIGRPWNLSIRERHEKPPLMAISCVAKKDSSIISIYDIQL